ncbi:iron-sulfur cluster carrier protein ApbC [Psychrobacter phenylpyruvicus]|uniref:Iron-sulfur cluster carrier protein n=1 Tax=Psychrobacter phenylpyruvicus TaxID=29432 RepID=A0A379LI85_9GAMM|nr:iron-sulfur cluster carrier protein ApbC [Psychrobacter phenylpyruvicus]SUD90309.1 antiporter inner membrane protein [Psychrobacter phenylpyruvicus]
MFDFIKKTIQKNTLKNEDSQQATQLEAVAKEVVANYPQGRDRNELTKFQHHGDTVTLDLRLDEEANPEEVQRQLGLKLKPLGIEEVNLNIALLPKATGVNIMPDNSSMPVSSTKGSAKTLPKTIDAAAKQSTAAEPPITKRAPTQSSLQPHPRIKHILVVASGKGGVGKSTTTVNIALALQKLGNRVGVLDADIYGPSMPSMLGVEGVKPQLENEQFVPVEAHGLAMLSIGSLLDGDNTPVAWRGPKATGALMQLFNQTNWPMLDYLVIDMPPGTGDIQLTLAQRIPVTGAVIVTTPQHIALMDAQKGIEMFNKTSIPVIGVVENMALHTCSNCGHTEAIFGAGGGESIAKEYQVPLLGQLPLASDIRAQADKGVPSVIANEGQGDDYAQFYLDIATNIEVNIERFAKKRDDGRIF